MKKLIILALIAIILIVGVFMGVRYLNQKTVTLTLDGSDYSVAINDSSSHKIKELKATGSIRLDDGTYSYQVIGNDFNSEQVNFTVDSDTDITVKSTYTAEKMFALLNQEVAEIRNLLTNTYSQKSPFDIENVKLHERGDWASAFLVVAVPGRVSTTYRTVLHKQDGSWKIIVKPSIAINAADYKDIPTGILNSLYEEID